MNRISVAASAGIVPMTTSAASIAAMRAVAAAAVRCSPNVKTSRTVSDYPTGPGRHWSRGPVDELMDLSPSTFRAWSVTAPKEKTRERP